MANKIAGLTIEIGGETSGLTKALTGVNKQSKDLQAELKNVDRLLKLDPKNTELLAQKQKLLSESVSTTKTKLDTLKEAEKQAQEQFKKGKIGEDQYRAISREVIKTEQDLKKLESSLKDTNAKWKDLGDNLQTAGTKMKDIGGTMSTKVTAPIVAGIALAVEGTKEFREELATLEVNAQQAGANIDLTNQALKDLNGISQDGGANVEALSNLLQAGFTDANLATLVDELSGAVIKFPDTLKIEGLADGLQETLATGEAIGPFSELLERMGVDVEVFNEGLAKASETGEEHNYVLQELSKLGLAEVNEAYRENNIEMIANADAQHDLAIETATLGETLEPILTMLKELLAELLGWFNNLSPEMKTTIGIIVGLVAAIGPLLMIVGQMSIGIGALITTFTAGGIGATAFGGFMAALTGPIGLVIAAVAAVIAIGVLLYKNWDTVKAKAGELWTSITGTFDKIKNSVTEKIEGAKEAVRLAIDKIKGFFDFKWEFPKLKMPHFSIKGKFSLDPPQIPKFGVDWYDKGGIFNSPSIIGVGEKRPEFVGALDDLRKIVREESGNGVNNKMLLDALKDITKPINLVLNGKEIGRILAPIINKELNTGLSEDKLAKGGI